MNTPTTPPAKFDRKQFGKQSKLLENAFDRVKREVDTIGLEPEALTAINEILDAQNLVLVKKLMEGVYTAPTKRKKKDPDADTPAADLEP